MSRSRVHVAFVFAWLAAVGLGAEAGGCSRDHGFLAATSSSSGAGGEGTTSASSGPGTGGAGVGGDNTGGEPPGPPRLTVLDAIADEDAVRLCFVPYPAGDPTAKPWPASASGLAFGEARVIDGDADVIPSHDDVLAIVIGGDLAQTAGKTCDEIVAEAGSGGAGGGGIGGAGGGGGAGGAAGAGGVAGAGGASSGGGGTGPTAPFVALALGVIPHSVFTAKRSLLLAPAGCLGGAGHDDPNNLVVCGAGYSPTTPTARLTALALSRRTTPNRVGLQVVHASVGTPALMVQVSPSNGSPSVQIAAALPFGGAEPTSPFIGFEHADFRESGEIAAYPTTGGVPLATTKLGDALAKGDGGEVADGHAYALVAIGAGAQVGDGPWWHRFTWATVRSDP